MQDQIHSARQLVYMRANDLAQPSLDAIAFMRLAQDLSDCESNAGSGRRIVAQSMALARCILASYLSQRTICGKPRH